MIDAKKIMEGCFLATAEGNAILLGCPSEITKVFLKRKEPMPTTIVLPSVFYTGGNLQASLEFPLYYFLFVEKGFFRGEKMRIIGTSDQVRRAKELLELTLFGPSEEIQKSWGIHPRIIEQQAKISKHLALKKSDGAVAQIEDMVEFIPFQQNTATVGSMKITLEGKNIFTVSIKDESMPIDLNFYGHQYPPIEIRPVNYHVERPAFGALALSKCTSGFDPSGYTTGFILWVNSMPIMIDGIPWTKDHLRALSISSTEVVAQFLSHIHEDHTSIIETIINGKKANIITTKEIFKSFVMKVSLILGWDESRVEEMLSFTEVVPGVPLSWYGAKFNFFRTVHTINTVGFEVEAEDKKIVYSGDTMWGEKLKKLLDGGIISREQYDTVDRIPRIESDLTIMDGGGGEIHGNPIELNKVLPWERKKNIFLTHLPVMPEGIEDLRTISPAKQWVLISSKSVDIGNINAIINTPLLKGMGSNWINTILTRGRLIEIETGDTVVKEGLPGKDFYIILSGTFSVITEDEEVAKLGVSDFFGEISLMNNAHCSATVRATCNSRLLEVPRDVFLEMIYSTGLSEKLRKIHRLRPVMMKCGWVKDLSPQIINRIISIAEERHYRAGDKIIIQGEIGNEFFLVRDGRVLIEIEENGMEQKTIATLFRGQSFGEMALLGNGKRSASVIADIDTSLLVLKGEDFKKLTNEVPALLYTFGVMAEERSKQ